MTDAGEMFYRHARIVLDAVAQAEASVLSAHDVLRGDLRVSVPPLMDESLSAMIMEFAEKYPDVRVQVDVSTRLVDLRREGYDVALRASSDLQPGLIARTVMREKIMAVASPAYLARMGTPRKLKDLREHRCLTGFARGELPRATWSAGRSVVRIDGSFSSNDLRLVRDAALRGLGIAMIPQIVLGDLVERGELVQVLPGVLESENRVSVVYVEREFIAPHVRAFVEAMVAWAPALQRSTR